MLGNLVQKKLEVLRITMRTFCVWILHTVYPHSAQWLYVAVSLCVRLSWCTR